MSSVFDPQGIMIFIQLDLKLYWFGLAHGMVYLTPVVARGQMAQDKIEKPMNKMRIVLKKGFNWLVKVLTEMVKEGGRSRYGKLQYQYLR